MPPVEFGICVTTKLTDAAYVRFCEDLGYDWAWVPDSQLIWGDCYAYMALAATQTSRIKLATGVAVAGTRSAPVIAHSIASVNTLAPGRIVLGIGSGNSAYRLMNHKPLPIAKYGEELRVIRALLAGEEVEYTTRGKTAPIRLLMEEQGYVNLADPVPIYVSGFGPKSQALAGRYGDGLVTSLPAEPRAIERARITVGNGAAEAGRTDVEASRFPTVSLLNVALLDPGEDVLSERMVAENGAFVISSLHYLYDQVKQYNREPPRHLADIWDEYTALVARTPEHVRHLRIHAGHCTYLLEEERKFLTPALMRTACLVGEADEVIEKLKELEDAGLDQIQMLPAPGTHYDFAKRFADQVMARY